MAEDTQPEMDEDHIVGRYIYVSPPVWGRTKVFYEKSGTGPQEIVFLHTAGSDSRQYHGVMNDKRMMEACTMIAFDLPAHGRSFPGQHYVPGNHTNTEDSYVGCIKEVVKALKLNKPIICGASMAGQVCVSVAIRAEEVCMSHISGAGISHYDRSKILFLMNFKSIAYHVLLPYLERCVSCSFSHRNV